MAHITNLKHCYTAICKIQKFTNRKTFTLWRNHKNIYLGILPLVQNRYICIRSKPKRNI